MAASTKMRQGEGGSSSAANGEATKQEKTFPRMTRDEVEALIADGDVVFVFRGFVLKANAWLKYHPGGQKAILHMVGRDATDEIDA